MSKGVIRFGVLGPLEVWRDGESIDLPAAKLRVILATLLLRSGQPVPLAELIQRLWETDPPLGARGAVQTYVTRLRRTLGVEGLLHNRHGAYIVEVPAGASDLVEFDSLLATARTARSAGDTASALIALRRATALWRGPILADVDSTALQRDDVPGILERCLEAAGQRFELELAAGNHRGVVEELRRMTTAYPLQEGLRGHLMRALHASGRRAEALAVYRETRDLLRTELGLEPGHELQAVHSALLRDETPPSAGTGVIATAYQAVCQLPPPTADFVGRTDQLSELEAKLAPDHESVPIVVLSGVAGVGKSTLAVKLGHRLRPAFPDGQLYVNLEGAGRQPRDPAEVLAELLDALGRPSSTLPHGLAARSAAFRARVADRNVLIVLDDAADAGQVAPLLPGTPGTAAVITSRRSLPELPATHRHRLHPFSVDEGMALLSRIVTDDRVRAESDTATEIVELCGRLPLAVRIIGARLQPRPTTPLGALAERLRDERQRLDELTAGNLRVRSELDSPMPG
ncbi:BTAD domain-containing putative transcriptional regulator [Dactylosporangium sp. CA-052675]|uniref:AfsR/SARP family transcriptional regulator n=1 Tax=Dactylosporangium sp. CA-052675 TaxID=3239927 RepID=UPI003D93D09E